MLGSRPGPGLLARLDALPLHRSPREKLQSSPWSSSGPISLFASPHLPPTQLRRWLSQGDRPPVRLPSDPVPVLRSPRSQCRTRDEESAPRRHRPHAWFLLGRFRPRQGGRLATPAADRRSEAPRDLARLRTIEGSLLDHSVPVASSSHRPRTQARNRTTPERGREPSGVVDPSRLSVQAGHQIPAKFLHSVARSSP